MTTEVERAGRRLQTRLFAVALVAVVAATSVGAWVVQERADDQATEQIERGAADAAAALEHEVRSVVDSLDGADALVRADRELEAEAFTGFGVGVLARRDLTAISLIGAEADGTYRPVAREGPDSASPGIDDVITPAVAATLDRAAATGEPAAGPATDPAGARAIVVARPIADRAGVVAGFVTLAVPDARIAPIIRDAVPAGTRAVLSGDDVALVGEPFERRDRTAEAPVRIGDRVWTITVGPRPAVELLTMWAVIAAGAAAALVLVAIAVVTARRQRRLLAANAELRRGRAHDLAVQEMMGHLARAITATEVVGALRDLLPSSVGARTAALGLVAGDGTLRVLDGTSQADGEAGERLAFAGTGSIAERVVTDGEPAWLSSPLEWRRDELVAALGHGGNALALLPLDSGDICGVLVVSYARFHVFDPGEQQVLATVAVLAGQALDRGHRYDTEHAAAVAFQKAALPDELPSVAGLSITARYRPALRHAAVGGDWYDVVRLDDHRTLLVVGDVVGHGMEAAAAMGRLRTALRVIATLDPDPGMILGRLGQQVDAIPDAFCATVLCAVVDRDAATFTWSRAGHLPPLVLTADGTELLDQKCSPPLGVVAGVDIPVHTRRLAPGDRVVLYTDGIVERRYEGIDTGLDRLAVMATTLSDLDPSEFTDTLVEAIVPHEGQTDDIAILVVGLAGECSPPATGATGCR